MSSRKTLLPIILIPVLMLGFQNCGTNWQSPQESRPEGVLPNISTSVQVSGGFNIGRDYVVDAPLEMEEYALPESNHELSMQTDLPVVLAENLSDFELVPVIPEEAFGYEIDKLWVHFAGENLSPLLFQWEPSEIEPTPPAQFDFVMLRGTPLTVTAWITTKSGARYLSCSQVLLSGQLVTVEADFKTHYPQNPETGNAIPSCSEASFQ